MTTSSAQAEFDELIRDKHREARHPEDRLDHDDDDSDRNSDRADDQDDDYKEKIDTDDELDLPADMRSNYYLPSIRSDANTGPKGVIADAHAFELAREQAKKQAKRFTWRKSQAPTTYKVSAYHDEKAGSSEDETEEGFLSRWRQARLLELQNAGQRIRSRTTSPSSRRIYGKLPAVDGEGYLEAVENSPRDTVVVVLIYDDLSDASAQVEHHMRKVAEKNETVRFVKFHYEDAEMEVAGVPAVLAYKNGNSLATLVPFLDELADDSELSPVSIENVLTRHRILG